MRKFELIGGHVALDFVNTLDWRFREGAPEELLASYEDLASFALQTGLTTQAQTRRLLRETSRAAGERALGAARQGREALAGVLYARVDGQKAAVSAIARLEDWIKEARMEAKLAPEELGFAWKLPDDAMRAETPALKLALAAEELITAEQMELVRACAKEDCRWLFLDTSKNRSRRWCDMKICGNRMKARRYKQQHA